MLMLSFIALLISSLMIFLNSLIANKSFNDREKISSFECGFNPLYFSRTPFSLQFFLIAVIFLIFDVEITVIMPIPLIINSTFTFNIIALISFFISILIMGLFYEWIYGALYWPK